MDCTEFPSVYLDAIHLHVRNKLGKGSQVVSMAVMVATGIAWTGPREILGRDVGDSEDETFWRAFPPSLNQCGQGTAGCAEFRSWSRSRCGPPSTAAVLGRSTLADDRPSHPSASSTCDHGQALAWACPCRSVAHLDRRDAARQVATWAPPASGTSQRVVGSAGT